MNRYYKQYTRFYHQFWCITRGSHIIWDPGGNIRQHISIDIYRFYNGILHNYQSRNI